MSTTHTPSNDELYSYVTSRGRCCTGQITAGHDPWFDEPPPRGRNSRQLQADRARRACNGCLVRTACLELSLRIETTTGVSWGVWGGTSPLDRRDLITKRTAAATLASALTVAGCELPPGAAVPAEHTTVLTLLALAVLHAAQARLHTAAALLHALTAPATTGPRTLAS